MDKIKRPAVSPERARALHRLAMQVAAQFPLDLGEMLIVRDYLDEIQMKWIETEAGPVRELPEGVVPFQRPGGLSA